jgi:hypothetical protein
MAGLPRLLAIMGSGETAPTMAKVHRRLLDRLASAIDGDVGGPRAVALDTPYGFQENADQLSARTADYFRQSVGYPIETASFRSADIAAADRERAMAQVRAAAYVFAGPGSPTYALAQWAGSPLPDILATKLAPDGPGGCVTFASAAALTLGRSTLPVYEIYKAGIPPSWIEGLDLLSAFGLNVSVIPHYDNAEGGTHDTRFCYLGERRLRRLEPELPDGGSVLGVDEHTAAVIDLDADTLTVDGLASVHLRHAGRTTSFGPGEVVSLDRLRHPSAADDGDVGSAFAPSAASAAWPPMPGSSADDRAPAPTPAGLLADVRRHHDDFDLALSAGDADAAVSAVLAAEQALVDWAADPLQSDEPDRARALVREMMVRLGDTARDGLRDPRDIVAPFVEAILAIRESARAANDWGTADDLRDRLIAAGVEVNDTADGTTWSVG